MNMYDILFILDKNTCFTDVMWKNSRMKELYAPLIEEWIYEKRTLASVFSIPGEKKTGEFVWDEEQFCYELMPGQADCTYLLCKKKENSNYLFAQALDKVTDGVQIYDKNAYAVYFNKSSRAISQIPDSVSIEGRHLLDMYGLEEETSTILTCLHTQSPVINRVDHYKSSDGISIATANTAYPIRRGKELLGAVVFEQSREIVAASIQKMEEIQTALKNYDSHSHHTRFSGYTFDHIIGHGENLTRAVAIAKRVAKQDNSVLLVGETGTGKEIFAQSIHRESPRKNKKFVALNCAAVPESLIESILFGTQKGSFTGSEDKAGYFEEACGGTLFLDELNSMSLTMQSKILRALQENTFRRVGGQKDIRMDVRIISSCNADPFHAIGENQLRKDLFYRLSTVMIELPSLKDHIEDLEELIRSHLESVSYQYVHTFTAISPAVMDILSAYSWPGNVRELFHVLDYAQNVADSDTLSPAHLPSYLTKKDKTKENTEAFEKAAAFPFHASTCNLQSLIDDYECRLLKAALDHFGYNISKTADALDIRRQSLQYRIKKYGIII